MMTSIVFVSEQIKDEYYYTLKGTERKCLVAELGEKYRGGQSNEIHLLSFERRG